MGLVGCKGALNPPVVYSTDRSRAVVPVLVLLFVAFWFILWGDLLYEYVLQCTLCHFVLVFSVLLALRLIDLCLFGFVGLLFPLVSGVGGRRGALPGLFSYLLIFFCLCD